MKVNAVLPDEGPFEIPKEDQIIELDIVAIICPICKSKAYKIEPDLYQCSNCDRLWNVE
jgi:transposase-like protein